MAHARQGVVHGPERPLERLDVQALRSAVASEPLRCRVRRIDVIAELPSTNAYLLAAERPPSGLIDVCLAERQTAGRGRRGRSWASPPGAGLYLSAGCTFVGDSSQLAALCPSKLLTQHGLWRPLELAAIKVQLDSSLGVVISHGEETGLHQADDIELFKELATQRFYVGFMRLALPAGEFPMPGEVGAIRAEAEEKFAVTLDDGRNHCQKFQGSRVPEFQGSNYQNPELWNLGTLEP